MIMMHRTTGYVVGALSALAVTTANQPTAGSVFAWFLVVIGLGLFIYQDLN